VAKPRVYVTREIPIDGLDLIRANCEMEIWPEEKPVPRDILMEKANGKAGLLTMLSDPIDAEVIEAAGPNLKVISNYAVGFDNIDLKTASTKGIFVGNTPDVLTETTADLAFSLLMAAARRLSEGVDYVRAGRWITWGPKLLRGLDIYGATLGVIGMGRIGHATARRGIGFEMNILYYDPHLNNDVADIPKAQRATDLDTLLEQSDFITLHMPLTPDTHHLIDAEALKKMKRTAVIVNTARGTIIDADALYEALSSGEIAYAALDVTDPEPLPAVHRLLKLPNCLVVPHIGSASMVTRAKMSVMAAENLLAGLRGEAPPHLVNPEALSGK